jgi:hypothetical protein
MNVDFVRSTSTDGVRFQNLSTFAFDWFVDDSGRASWSARAPSSSSSPPPPPSSSSSSSSLASSMTIRALQIGDREGETRVRANVCFF